MLNVKYAYNSDPITHSSRKRNPATMRIHSYFITVAKSMRLW